MIEVARQDLHQRAYRGPDSDTHRFKEFSEWILFIQGVPLKLAATTLKLVITHNFD